MAKSVFKESTWANMYQHLGYRANTRVRLEAGPLLQLLLKPISDHIATTSGSISNNGNDEAVFHLYSARDQTITMLLAALGYWHTNNHRQWSWPAYMSHIAIELWNTPTNLTSSTTSSKLMVRVLYNNNALQLGACNGSYWCDASSFVDTITTKYIDDDMVTACQAGL
jgi:hypothetical protein